MPPAAPRRGWGLLRLLAALVATLGPLSGVAAPACTVRAQTLAFGSYNTINSLSGVTTITLRCRSIQQGPGGTVAYSVALSAGSGSYGNRRMNFGANVLFYNVYTDASHSTVWGNGTGGTQSVNGSFTSPPRTQTVSLTVYGLIPGPQNVVPGNYATTTPITVTVTY